MTAIALVAGALVGAAPAHAVVDVLSGQVTGADTSTGVQNITLGLYDTTGSDFVTTVTDATGHYSFATIPHDGTYRLVITTKYALGRYVGGYLVNSGLTTPFPSQATVLNLTASAGAALDILLAKAGSITGTISYAGPATPSAVEAYAYDPATSAWVLVDFVGVTGEGEYGFFFLGSGTYRVLFKDYSSPKLYTDEYYDDARTIEESTPVVVTAPSVTSGIDAYLTAGGPLSVKRLAGSDRYATSARVAQEYDSADVVFIASGQDFPDALSAAPAAAQLGGPLLLTRKGSLPADVKAQIVRLHPLLIVVVGGAGVVSQAVFNELVPLASQVRRASGGDRYATSRAVVELAWEGADALIAYLADGRNFPDALSSGSVAAKVGGPVVLVNGGASSIPAAVGLVLDAINVETLRIVGGTAVVSQSIQTAAGTLPGITLVERTFGSDRYATSVAVNRQAFAHASTVYLAVGTGYADALAGAALAGSTGDPLYLVRATCIPASVLEDIHTLGASRIVLLGGTGVLSAGVEALEPCGGTA